MNNLKISIEAALFAGKKIMDIYANDDLFVKYKEDNSPLTLADIASHECIDQFLKNTGIPVLSEEGKTIPFVERKSWDQLWIVDPLDGTKEFIKRNGEFTVNIALIQNNVPILGVIYVPVLKELYFSERNLGSFKVVNVDHTSPLEEILKNGKKLPLQKENRNYTVVASRSHLSEETKNYIDQLEIKHNNVDSISKGSSLKLCMVAEGSADCYPRFAPTMEWDTAAGHSICKYAGFILEDYITKKEMLYNRENLRNNWFLVY